MILTKQQILEKYPNAIILEGAVIREGVVIGADVFIGAGAIIGTGAAIREGVVIGKGAVIGAGAIIGSGAVIGAGAIIGTGAIIGALVRIGKGAFIGRHRKNVHTNIVILGIGATQNITGFLCDDGAIVTIGCQNNWQGRTIDEMRLEVAKKYPTGHEYFDALNLIEKFLNRAD